MLHKALEEYKPTLPSDEKLEQYVQAVSLNTTHILMELLLHWMVAK
jgi:hypothetical protein